MVVVRQAVESSYIGKCTIWEQKKVKRLNGSTDFEPVEVEKDIPCKLSFSNVNSTDSNNNAAVVNTSVKLIINPDIIIQPGSMIAVTQNGRKSEYGASGEPAVYFSHQEIILESFGGWS